MCRRLLHHHITTSPHHKMISAANVSFIARLRLACRHFVAATWSFKTKWTMKTTSHLRMFIVITMMTASACSDPEVLPTTKRPGPPGNQNTTSEYHTTVTAWSRISGSSFVGLVSEIPTLNLSKAAITVVGNGKMTGVDPYFDASRLTLAHAANEGYIWASTQNNILLLNFVGNTPTSLPPFSLEVIIVY